MSDQEDLGQDLTPSQEHTIAFAVILIFGAMYLFFMKGCQPIASSIGQALSPPQTIQVSHGQSYSDRLDNKKGMDSSAEESEQAGEQLAKSNDADSSVNKASTSKKNGNAANAQAVASVDSSAAPEVSNEQAKIDQQARAEAQARDAAKIKAEAASLAAASAAAKLADEKRFEAKQAELKAGQAELAIPAKPDETVAQQQPANAAPNVQNQGAPEMPADSSAAGESQNKVADSDQQKPFNINDELARLDFTLPDGRSIQIPQQGFESRLKQAVLQDGVEQPIVFDRISFFSGSDLLNPESSNQILGVAGIMNTYRDVNIKLRGHTDSSGVAEENLTLSFKRSQNLKNQLVGLGIDANRIQVEGLGSSEPISDNASEKGRNKNRRIDLTIIRER